MNPYLWAMAACWAVTLIACFVVIVGVITDSDRLFNVPPALVYGALVVPYLVGIVFAIIGLAVQA